MTKPKQRYNVMVEARDGARLATDLYLPDGDGPFPVVVGRTPYNKNQAAFANLGKSVNAKGYALVVQDVRGRGDSDGSFVPYANDGPDGYDMIEWVAAQPWCDGNVAYRGASYGARAGWMVGLERPPHLRAMVLVVSPSDPFVEFPTSGTTPMMVSWYRLTDGRMSQSTAGVNWMEVYEHLPLMELDEVAGFSSTRWREAMTHTSLDDYWDFERYQHRYGEIDVPIMHISGWYDDEQIGTPRNYIGMRADAASEAARDGQRLLMGPWGHGVNSSTKLGEVEFGPSAVIDLESYIATWLDGIVGRAETDVPRVRIFVMGSGWRDEEEWPLARTNYTEYFLHSGGSANSRYGDGVLSTDQPAPDEPPDVYTYDPARPVPFITEPTSSQLGGPDDYSAVEQRGDVLCYTTDELTEAIEVTGLVKLVLCASSSAVDTDFTGKLVDVHPSGFCQRLTDSIIRARYRNGPERAEFMTPDEVYEFEIDLWNTSHIFEAGHRIRLEVASSAFPKYDRNLNTGEDIGTGVRMAVATNRVSHDAEHPSKLVLPVIAR
jgi:putative CocE/NonD family hydrolase